MNFEQSQYSQELKVAREAAEKAGEMLDRYRENGVKIDGRKKHHNDIVTEADLEAQREIVKLLRDEFPGDAVKAEEEDLSEDHSDRVWVIDPIDGTTNYHQGLDYFCTSIGLRVGRRNVLGVVHSPESGLGETYIGVGNHGAHRLDAARAMKGEHLSTSGNGMKGGLYTAYVRDGHLEMRARQMELIEELSSLEMVHRARGSAALDICRIASGEMELLAGFLSEWDYAGGKAILEQAGGELSVLETDISQQLVLATDGARHEEMRELAEEVLERF